MIAEAGSPLLPSSPTMMALLFPRFLGLVGLANPNGINYGRINHAPIFGP